MSIKLAAGGLFLATLASGPANASGSVEFDFSHISETWAGISGGVDQDIRYLAYADAGISVDGNTLLNWHGASARVSAIYSNGTSVTDMTNALHAVSGIETDVSSVWLYEAWIEQTLGENTSIRAGLQEINEEFDASETRGVFIHSAHGVGGEFGASGITGPSTYPYTGLGLRFRHTLRQKYYMNIAAFDGVPGSATSSKSTVIKLGRQEGALIVAEAGYEAGKSKISAGYWLYTAGYEDVLLTDALGDPLRHKGNDGFYALAETSLYSEENAEQGLVGFVRAGVADGKFNAIDTYISVGGVYTGPVPGRDDDQIGLAVIASSPGSSWRERMALAGEEVAGHELSIELTWKAPVAEWVYLQPDVQYVINPGLDPGIKDALLIGLRLGLEW